MTIEIWRVDRTLLHKPAWNCHHDCADVVMLADYQREVSALRELLLEQIAAFGQEQDKAPSVRTVQP